MSVPNDQSGLLPDGIDLGRLVAALRHRAWIVVLATSFAPLVAVTAANVVPKKFKASAQVYVEDSVAVNPFLEDMRVAWTVKSRLPVIQAVIKSRQILVRVLEQMGDIDESSQPAEVEAAVRNFRRRITVFGMGGGLVAIQLIDSSPERVFKGLDLLVRAFVDEMLRPQKQSLDEATVFLDGQLKRVRDNLDSLELDLQSFKEDHAAELPEVFKVNLETYMRTQQQLLDARSELEAKRREKTALSEQLRIFDPVAQRVESDLIRTEAELQRLSAVYTDFHPKVVAMAARARELRTRNARAGSERKPLDLRKLESIASTTNQFEVDATTGKTSVSSQSRDVMTGELLRFKATLSELRTLESRVAVLEKRSTELMGTVRSNARNERQLGIFERDVVVKLRVYQKLLEKYEDAKVTRELALADEKNQVWIIEAPVAPSAPSNPHWVLFLLGGLAGGLAAGVSLVLVLEFTERRVRCPQDVTDAGLLVIGVIPRVRRKRRWLA